MQRKFVFERKKKKRTRDLREALLHLVKPRRYNSFNKFKKVSIAISLKSKQFRYRFPLDFWRHETDTKPQLFYTEHTLNQLQNMKIPHVATLICKQLSTYRLKLILTESNFTVSEGRKLTVVGSLRMQKLKP